MGLALTAADLSFDEDAPTGEIDPTTLALCRAGDPAALRRFVLRYQHTVFAFLSRMMGAGPHVEDMAQEVFLRAYRALPRFELREDARVSTWLLKIAVRLVQDARKRRVPEFVPLDEQSGIDPLTPELERRRRELVEAFERAAAQLTDEQRVVFVLAHFHGLSMTEIAQLVGAPENTVKTRLFRARERLRMLLEAIR
ncbi:MAG TPA: sigma-70 family RNA polymerase sigma factor [Polyangiaceae bacterium]|jgi:RNA polymerase sigma-70 factor (ECF subfamily)|nr:sigma-70 family RNA polymerase sigma factor [Polyangiaceae bacterium]